MKIIKNNLKNLVRDLNAEELPSLMVHNVKRISRVNTNILKPKTIENFTR
jgi:hypothetical protein